MSQIEVNTIDHMGSDLSVVNAARVSFGKKSEELGFISRGEKCLRPILHDTDKRLIKYLAKHKHMSPFGHAFASFHIKAPIFVARQLVKHKFLRWNEISRRYVDDDPEFFMPDQWRGRADDKKQGSAGVVDVETLAYLSNSNDQALATYQELLNAGVCPEQARMVLPQSTMTEWYWSGSLDAFVDMCKLRLSITTQYETQVVAARVAESLDELYPISWAALMEGDDDG